MKYFSKFISDFFVRKISCRKHASAWPCSVLLGSAWPCLVPVASLVGGPGGPWPPQNFRIFFLFIDKNLCKNCVYTFCVYFIPSTQYLSFCLLFFMAKNLCKNCVYTFCVYFIPRIQYLSFCLLFFSQIKTCAKIVSALFVSTLFLCKNYVCTFCVYFLFFFFVRKIS